ncbi:MAG: FAD-dependent oxidoreductase, partial [Synergistaceae bacterium]|nr:FAD-dependent oxidoreductase [Synergistaceae bacterium]
RGGFLIGATREFVGFNRSTTTDGVRAVTTHAARMVPALKEIRAVRCFSGLRPYTPDGKAFIGKVPKCEGLYVAAGHEGDGIAYAPITGRVMSELVLDGTSSEDLLPFSLDRLENLGGTV